MTHKVLLAIAFLCLLPRCSVSQDAQRLGRSCEAGDALACNDLGFVYTSGAGVAQDLARQFRVTEGQPVRNRS